MAKKRRINEAEPEEEYEFIPPEFDEKEFILKDFYGTKILLVVAVISIIVGILCSCLEKMSADFGFYLGLLLLFLGAAALKPLLKIFKFDADLIESKSMIGNYIMFILLGLGFWVLFMNPPFA